MIHCSALVVVSWRYVSCMVLLIYSCRSVWAKADHGSQYTKMITRFTQTDTLVSLCGQMHRLRLMYEPVASNNKH